MLHSTRTLDCIHFITTTIYPPHSRSTPKRFLAHPLLLLRHWENRLTRGLGLGQRTMETELRAEAVDAVGGIQILDHNHLVAGGAALARGDARPGEEELPNAVPALSVLLLDGVGVAEPVAVPAPESARVVDANGVDAGEC